MPAVTRDLAITYGALVCGGSTNRLIDGYLKIDKSFTTASLSFDLIITAASDSLFATEIALVEAAFREPFQDLLVEQGSSALLELKPSNNTGLNTMPSISKSGDPRDTGRSRKYSIRIDCELPADNAPTVGLRESSVNVSFTPSRKRRVTISGVVTAQSADDARAKYEAIIDTYTAAVLAALGGTYELGEEPTTTNDYEDKTISFTQIFDEIIYSEAGSASDVRIVRQVVVISRGQTGPGDSASYAKRLVNLSCTYEAWIDKDETQDLPKVWDSIKAWVYTQIQNTFATGVIAVMDSSPRYDFTENRITVSISALGTSGSPYIEYRSTTQISDVFGVILVPAWDGDPLAKYAYQGPATRRRTSTAVLRVLAGTVSGSSLRRASPRGTIQVGTGGKIGLDTGAFAGMVGGGVGITVNRPKGGGGGGGGFGFAGFGGGGGGGGGGAEWVTISSQEAETPLTLGTDGKTFDVIDSTSTTVEEAYVPVTAAPTQIYS